MPLHHPHTKRAYQLSCTSTIFYSLASFFFRQPAVLAGPLGIISNGQQPALTGVQFSGIPHFYDTRMWLGKGNLQVCHELDLLRDLLYISINSCITPRFAASLQHPVLIIPLEPQMEGCLSDISIAPNSNHFVRLPLFGARLADMIPELLYGGYSWANAVIIHVCDKEQSFCEIAALNAAKEILHQLHVTTVQYSMEITSENDFMARFTKNIEMVASLDHTDRRILISINTSYKLIAHALRIMTARMLLNVFAEIVFTVSQGYNVWESDFLMIKEYDNVRVVRWQGESWVATVTGRVVDRYSSFWGYPTGRFLQNKPQFTSQIAGILSLATANPYFVRLVNMQNPSDVKSSPICCADNTTRDLQLQSVGLDLWKTLSCSPVAGVDICSSYTIFNYDVVPHSGVVQAQTTGIWSPVKGYQSIGSRQIDNLRGRKFRIVTFEAPPFLEKKNQAALDTFDGTDVSDLYDGIIPNMLLSLSKVMNFSYEIVFPNLGDEFYGALQKNGSWNGMIGMLHRGEVDMIAADLTITGPRQEVVDFTSPFYEDKLTVLLPRSEFERTLFAFLLPFNKVVWGCVLASVAFAGPILYLLSKCTPFYEKEGKNNHLSSLAESSLYCYGSLINQGGVIAPESDSSRMFMISWWIFGMCTVAMYSGNFIAFLTFPGKTAFTTNIAEFVYSSNIMPVVTRNTFSETIIKQSSNPIYQDLWAKIMANEKQSFVDFVSQGLQRVDTMKSGYIGSRAAMRSLIAKDSQNVQLKERCKFAIMKTPMQTSTYGLAFRKGTNFAMIFNKWIHRMTNAGIVDHWINRQWERSYNSSRCLKELERPPDEARKVTINDVLGLYLCLAGGIGFALVIFAFEVFSSVSFSFSPGKWIATHCCFQQGQEKTGPHQQHVLSTAMLNQGAANGLKKSIS